MSANIGTPRCFVDIYPWEGGSFTLTGDNAALLACNVSKSVTGEAPGTFNLALAPGGPNGPNVSPQWLDIITVLSLVVIGMQRAGHKQIVMVGVVTQISAPQAFVPARNVQRTTTISGMDFQYFFTQRSFYALTFLAMDAGVSLSALGLPSLISNGLLMGTPDSIGATWYSTVMAGTKGILTRTEFAYRNGARLAFPLLMATLFEGYPTSANAGIGIASSSYFAAQTSWIEKFFKIFPYPWYEFFIMTAPVNYYSTTTFQNATINATPATWLITMDGFDPVSPTLVARVNPLPWSENQGTPVDPPNLEMNYDRWFALDEFLLDVGGPISQNIAFDESEVRNFYILNPMYAPFPFGTTNAQLSPFVWQYGSWTDPASVQRYGYRPQINELPWFSDPSGLQAQKNAAAGTTDQQMSALVANVALRQTSYYQPTPLMARGSVTTTLRPDIIAGNRFSFAPFKEGTTWNFYIDAVTHNYQFGRSATTTLQLSRGLPEPVYESPSLLLAIHTGAAMRQNGIYVPTGQAGLQPLNSQTMQNLYGQITAEAFQTPQGK